MGQYDFAIVADGAMLNGAFMLRQVLTEWYSVALWSSEALDEHVSALAETPKVLFIGPNPHTNFFSLKVGTRWEGSGAKYGFKGRTAIISAENDLLDDPVEVRSLRNALAALRTDIVEELEAAPDSPGVNAATRFLNLNPAVAPPAGATAIQLAGLTQYQIAIAEFLTLAFDDWCWRKR